MEHYHIKFKTIVGVNRLICIVVVFAVIICIPEYRYVHASSYIFFLPDKNFWIFLIKEDN